MKRILLIIMTIFACVHAHATTMCIHTDSYVATLVKSRDGISQTVNSDGTFYVTFEYFTSSREYGSETAAGGNRVYGVAACNEIVGTHGVADGSVSTATIDVGENCWCGMTYPAVSDWVFNKSYASDAACAADCTTSCATLVRENANFRGAIYTAIW